jgi:uncharacterized membrane protein
MMKNFLKRKFSRLSEKDIVSMETQLATVLTPVIPSAEFVSDLRTGLLVREIKMASSPLVTRKISNGLLVVGGIFGSLLMIIAGIRGLISLFGLIGLFFQYLTRNSQGGQRRQATSA